MDFRQFTPADFEATLKKWESEAIEHECFPDEVQQKLGPVKASFTGSLGEVNTALYYGVFQPGQTIATALCSLVLSNRGQLGGKWLKMLTLTLSPEVDTLKMEENFEATALAVDAYKAAVKGAFAARLEHEADTLKLYGRSEEQLQFLMVMLTIINKDPQPELIAKREGRWLVLRTSTATKE